MSGIFISHRSGDTDKAVADELHRRLSEDGYDQIFLDTDPSDGIQAGSDWEKVLHEEVNWCRVVIVVHSVRWSESRWCFTELTHARALGKTIIPVKIDGQPLDKLLANYQVVDMSDMDESALDVAYADLESGLKSAGIDPDDPTNWGPDQGSPYPGLSSFQAKDEAVFFGREDEIDAGLDLLNRVRRRGSDSLTMVLGASGSGKSSLVRAGVAPKLGRDESKWIIANPFRPGNQPFGRLAEELAELFGGERAADELEHRLQSAPGGEGDSVLVELAAELRRRMTRPEATLVIVVDQFEELLGPAAAADRDDFLRTLVAATTTPNGGVIVIGTLRSDFLGLFQNSGPIEGVAYHTLLVDPLVSRLEDVIAKPASAARLTLEPGLVAKMAEDARSDDSLPLLAFTLRKLWEEFGQPAGRITLEDYEGIGGLDGSIARAADRVLDEQPLDREQEDALCRAFLAMARANGPDWTRNVANWSEIDPSILQTLERFRDARLLVITRGPDGAPRTIEVAHEALLRSWPPLGTWLKDNVEQVRLRTEIDQAAEDWNAHDRDPEVLWRGTKLRRALELRDAGTVPLDELGEEFVREAEAKRRAAQEAEEREAAEKERRRRRQLQWAVAGVIVVSLVGVLALVLFFRARSEEQKASRARDEATASALAARSRELQGEDPALAVAVALEAMAQTEPPQPVATEALIGAQAAYQDVAFHETGRLDHPSPPAEVLAVDVSADGGLIATARTQPDNTVRIWSDPAGPPIDEVVAGGRLRDMAMTPDGTRLVVAFDQGANALVRVYSLADGVVVGSPAEYRHPADGERASRVRSVAFSPDGTVVAAGDNLGRLFLWEGTTGDTGAEVELPVKFDDSGDPQRPAVLAVAFDPSGEYVAAARASGDVELVNTATREVVTLSSPNGRRDATAVAFHPDGDVLAAGYRQGAIFLWRDPVGQPDQMAESLEAHTDNVLALEFSAVEEDWLVSSSRDRTIRLWSIDRARQIGAPSQSHTDWVNDLAFVGTGRDILSGSRDSTARFFTYQGTSLLGHHDNCELEKELGCFATDVAFNVDDTWLASAAFDGSVVLWPLPDRAAANPSPVEPTVLELGDESGDELPVLDEPELSAVVFSPVDPDLLIATGDGDRVWWWDGDGERLESTMHRDLEPGDTPSKVRAAAFNEDGSLAATADDAGVVVLWDVGARARRGTPLEIPPGVAENDREIHALAFDPEDRLVIGDRAGRLWIWDWLGGRGVVDAAPDGTTHESNVRGLAFSADGRLMASGGRDNLVKLWAVEPSETLREVATLEGHAGEVADVDFHPGGGWLASPGNEGNLRLWSIGTDGRVEAEIIPDPRCGAGDRCFVLGADFSNHGGFLATAESDGGIRLWRGRLWDLDRACEIAAQPITAAGLAGELDALGLPPSRVDCPEGS